MAFAKERSKATIFTKKWFFWFPILCPKSVCEPLGVIGLYLYIKIDYFIFFRLFGCTPSTSSSNVISFGIYLYRFAILVDAFMVSVLISVLILYFFLLLLSQSSCE